MSDEKKRKMHPNSLKNLIRHKKGEPSFNPKGRPKKEQSLTEAVRGKIMTGTVGKRPRIEVMAEKIADKAMTDPRMTKLVWERLEGAVPQPIEGKLEADVTWVIGKGYANTEPGIQADQ